MSGPRITVLAGGVGGAKFVLGLRAHCREHAPDAAITVVANTGDDVWLAGLRVTPDLDSLMYALAGVNDTLRGWGRASESERVAAELAAFGVGWPWFTLGDLDLGTHIARTSMLRDGLSLSAATERLSERWPLGVRLLPMSDAETPTIVSTDEGDLHFEEWWVRTRAALPARGFRQEGIAAARPAPGVVESITGADVVLLAPSNPVVSIGPILQVPGIRDAVRATDAPVIGVSPIIGGAVVRGMADACLTAIGVATSAAAVAQHYGPRSAGDTAHASAGGVLDGWLVDEVDAASVDEIAHTGIRTRAIPLWMHTDAASAAIASAALELAALA